MKMPKIKKASRIFGKNIVLRNVQLDDAVFILSLRNNPEKKKFISETSIALEEQEAWLETYLKSEDQAYFIIEDKCGDKLGCIRMYDPQQYSFCWGSWLLINGLSPLIAIESVLLIYAYGLELGFKEARFSVRKSNSDVCKFHEHFFNAVAYDETTNDYFYTVENNKINDALFKYKNIWS